MEWELCWIWQLGKTPGEDHSRLKYFWAIKFPDMGTKLRHVRKSQEACCIPSTLGRVQVKTNGDRGNQGPDH